MEDIMPRVTLETLIATASPEDLALLRSLLSVNPAKASASERTFRTAAERAAGAGFACTADPACARHDLRTSKNASSHVLPNGHVAR